MIAPPTPPCHDQLEALIKEARERQRRRRVKVTAIVAALAAGATGIYSIAAGGASHPTTASDRGPRAAAGPCASAAGWRLQSGGVWSEPTGQHTDPISLVRTGSSSCLVNGYPIVVLRTASGRTIPFRYTHRGDMVVANKPPRPVRIPGNGHAFFVFNKYRCDVHDTMISRWLLVRLRGVRGWLRLRMAHYPVIDFCPGAGPSRTIGVSPIVGRLAQATARLP